MRSTVGTGILVLSVYLVSNFSLGKLENGELRGRPRTLQYYIIIKAWIILVLCLETAACSDAAAVQRKIVYQGRAWGFN